MNSGPKPTDPQSGLSPRQISLASLLVALAAFVVGALGYALANSVQEEQQELIVHAAAATNPRYDLLAGQGVNLSISNESLRAIIVDRIDLSVDGERLTSAETYLPDARLLEQHALAPDRLATEAQLFRLRWTHAAPRRSRSSSRLPGPSAATRPTKR